MLQHDAEISRAERANRLHVLELSYNQYLATNKSRHSRPANDSDRREDDALRRLEGRNHRNEQQQCRKRERDVGESHHDLVDPSAVKSGEESKRDAERERNSLGDQTDGERYSRAIDQTRPDVPALDVRPEPVLRGRPLQKVREIDRNRALPRNQRSKQRGEAHDQDDRYPDSRPVVAKESATLLWVEHFPPSLSSR